VDEFQNFATESFATILSEARKYHMSLIVGHQYIGQLISEKNNTKVRDAVFGNVGTIISFRVGAADAEFLEQEFEPTFMQNDLVNLPRATVVLRLMINGVASDPFTAVTLPPGTYERTGNAAKVIRVSRERYANPVAEVEDKITRWMSGDEVRESSAAIASYAKIEGREEDDEDDGVKAERKAEAVSVPFVAPVQRAEAVPIPVQTPVPVSAPIQTPVPKPFVQAPRPMPQPQPQQQRPVVRQPVPRPPQNQQPVRQAQPHGGQHGSQHSRSQPPAKKPASNPIWDRVAEINQQRTRESVQSSQQIAKDLDSQPFDSQPTRVVLKPGESQKVNGDDFSF
jgi:hypothetical protein